LFPHTRSLLPPRNIPNALQPPCDRFTRTRRPKEIPSATKYCNRVTGNIFAVTLIAFSVFYTAPKRGYPVIAITLFSASTSAPLNRATIRRVAARNRRSTCFLTPGALQVVRTFCGRLTAARGLRSQDDHKGWSRRSLIGYLRHLHPPSPSPKRPNGPPRASGHPSYTGLHPITSPPAFLRQSHLQASRPFGRCLFSHLHRRGCEQHFSPRSLVAVDLSFTPSILRIVAPYLFAVGFLPSFPKSKYPRCDQDFSVPPPDAI
jgi:hypothetical protein